MPAKHSRSELVHRLESAIDDTDRETNAAIGQ